MPSVFYFEVEYESPEDDWNEYTGLIDNSIKIYNQLMDIHDSAIFTRGGPANNPRIKYIVSNKATAQKLLKKVEHILDIFNCEIIDIEF
ncbi:MAG: hypothetical protein PHC28_05820 [Flavobacterium sp.]|uniref:hypothetical protein n=1 Tax=Flavobacterium sp. TaxID=239 RepID=UPI0026101D7A|nr:hypothetical protein [Flavobacterium sp.]MDD5149986.1 hypothetical protein [Flavobacterium sp.]